MSYNDMLIYFTFTIIDEWNIV